MYQIGEVKSKDFNFLLNTNVTHKKYGKGNIVEVNDKIIIIKFDKLEEVKKFIYPDSFNGYMTFENTKIQNETMRLLETEEAKKRVEEELKRQDYEKIEEEKRNESNDKLKKQKKATKAKADRDRDKALKLLKEEISEANAVKL